MYRLSNFSIFLFLFLALQVSRFASAEEIPMYTYHNLGPFIIGEKQGLTYELAIYLNQHAKGRWTFTVKPSPRMRFNKTITLASKGIVPWVNPKWFKSLELENGLWTSAYFKGANVIVSRRGKKIEYDGMASLSGYTILKAKGGIQKTIDSYIKQGNISLVETDSFKNMFIMLSRKRADFISVPLSMVHYMIPKLELEENLYVSGNPVDQYARHFLVLKGHSDLYGFLSNTVKNMVHDPIWVRILKRYNLAQLNIATD